MGLTDYFVFGDMTSSDYGFYVSGEGTFNAPERDYEVIEIPGRNGNLVLSNNRFKNTTVVYPCVFHKIGKDFPTAIADFRNALLSADGYQILYDTHHPDEYRLGVCRDVIEVDPTEHDLIAVVKIEFDCKPQRFLKSGEQKVSVASGDIIVNPTPFGSSPLLEVEGYGNILIGEQPVNIIGRDLGKTRLTDHIQVVTSPGADADVEASYFNVPHYSGDQCFIQHTYRDLFSVQPDSRKSGFTATVSSGTNIIVSTGNTTTIRWEPPKTYYTYGDTGTITGSAEVVLTWLDSNIARTATITLTYNGVAYGTNNKVISYTTSVNISGADASLVTRTRTERDVAPYIVSTYSALGNPLYVDLETGNAWRNDDGDIQSVNGAVWMGANLPVLKPGENAITYNSTIQDLKITPRWWQI